MKKITINLVFVILVSNSFSQSISSNDILLRYDTTILMASECNWIIKSPINNVPAITIQAGKSITEIMLELVKNGKLKAFDPQTNELIPRNKIFTWRQSIDTTTFWDPGKEKILLL